VAALAALHGSGAASARGQVAAAPLHTRALLLDRLGGKVLRRVQAALPTRADAIAARIEGLLRWQPPLLPPQATLHGNLRTGKLLLSPLGELVILDLGGMVRGEAALDLARLASELVLQSLLGQVEPRSAWAIATGLPAAYLQALQQRHDEHAQAILALPPHAFQESCAWYLTALLLSEQLETCVRHAAPAMDGLCVELVRLAGGMLADRGAAMLGAGRSDPPSPATA
jgi:aminoglycoside phosphotransferase (APT) family kinase protein